MEDKNNNTGPVLVTVLIIGAIAFGIGHSAGYSSRSSEVESLQATISTKETCIHVLETQQENALDELRSSKETYEALWDKINYADSQLAYTPHDCE